MEGPFFKKKLCFLPKPGFLQKTTLYWPENPLEPYQWAVLVSILVYVAGITLSYKCSMNGLRTEKAARHTDRVTMKSDIQTRQTKDDSTKAHGDLKSALDEMDKKITRNTNDHVKCVDKMTKYENCLKCIIKTQKQKDLNNKISKNPTPSQSNDHSAEAVAHDGQSEIQGQTYDPYCDSYCDKFNWN